jgi:hypothetical protein
MTLRPAPELALAPRPTRSARRQSLTGALVASHWRGGNGAVASAALPVVLLLVLSGVMSLLLDSVDWVWHYRVVAAALIIVISLLLAVSVWGLVGAARAGKRAHENGAGLLEVRAGASVVAACALATSAGFAFQFQDSVSWLWALTTDTDERAEIVANTALGRLVVRGSFGFGTTLRVDAALRSNPAIRLVELDSPGGYAVEGLALGKVLEARAVDTLVLNRCASACISAFAAGDRRWLGAQGRLGFHTVSGGKEERAMALNRKHAEFMRQRGVAGWLIEQELETPFKELLVPGPITLLASGLVTDMWEWR